MPTFQVEWRAYNARFEGEPPPWTAEPWGNITRVGAEALERMRLRLEEVKMRSAQVSFPAIVEVRVVSSDGRVVSYESWRKR